MPDVATVRDVARKLERWRDTLEDGERETLTRWMAAGVGREQLEAGRRWWFDPDADERHPNATAVERPPSAAADEPRPRATRE